MRKFALLSLILFIGCRHSPAQSIPRGTAVPPAGPPPAPTFVVNPPTVSDVTDNSATIAFSIGPQPDGYATSVTLYRSVAGGGTANIQCDAIIGSSLRTGSLVCASLTSSTLYNFKMTAVNSAGSVDSNTGSFTTDALPTCGPPNYICGDATSVFTPEGTVTDKATGNPVTTPVVNQKLNWPPVPSETIMVADGTECSVSGTWVQPFTPNNQPFVWNKDGTSFYVEFNTMPISSRTFMVYDFDYNNFQVSKRAGTGGGRCRTAGQTGHLELCNSGKFNCQANPFWSFESADIVYGIQASATLVLGQINRTTGAYSLVRNINHDSTFYSDQPNNLMVSQKSDGTDYIFAFTGCIQGTHTGSCGPNNWRAIIVWDKTTDCRQWLDTANGVMYKDAGCDAALPTGTIVNPLRTRIHAIEMSTDGRYISYTLNQCTAGCSQDGGNVNFGLWDRVAGTVTTCSYNPSSHQCGGHFSLGWAKIVNTDGAGPLLWRVRTTANPTSQTLLITGSWATGGPWQVDHYQGWQTSTPAAPDSPFMIGHVMYSSTAPTKQFHHRFCLVWPTPIDKWSCQVQMGSTIKSTSAYDTFDSRGSMDRQGRVLIFASDGCRVGLGTPCRVRQFIAKLM